MEIFIRLGHLTILMLSMISVAVAQQQSPPNQLPTQLTPEATKQIQALHAEKVSRTPAQRKISSALLYELKRRRQDALLNEVPMLRSQVEVATDGTTLVDIQATVTDELLDQIRALGGTVINSFPQYNAIRASIPLDQIEDLAALPAVQSIRPADKAMTHKINTSEGDAAHRANTARSTFGFLGTGVKIGVISDSVDALASLQSSGDLPAVAVLTGQSGVPGTSEGTAMLEIVNDLAPGAQLYFATANGGQAQFAQNILDLRTAGCNVIVDDVGYFAEGVFQDGIVAQAVNQVTAGGSLYFSAAGNEGNLNDGTSGVWEGDYVVTALPAPLASAGLDANNFGSGPFNRITQNTSVINLAWSDALGQSANDYDLFLLDSTGTNVLDESQNFQSGTQDPYEQINGGLTNQLLVIVRFAGASRFMHLNTNRGRLQIGTAGQTSGHSAATNAFSVAAVPVHGVTPFNGTESVETYSSDGLRRIFYQANGTPITPGNFSSTGGTVRQKPDIAAADCVSTATVPPVSSGLPANAFNPFCGTSAAAPHAAAIAGLMLSANHSLTPAMVRAILTGATWDIEAAGVDRDSGAGIVDALTAVQASLPAGPVPGDLNGDGKADLAGLASNGQIFYTTNLSGWTNIPGTLSQLVTGDFNGDGKADLAGLTSTGKIFYTTNLSTWTNIPGTLSQLVAGDFNGDGKADLAGLASNGQIFYTTNLSSWTNIPGLLSKLVAGDLNGDGKADLAGLANNGQIFYTTNLSGWTNIPGTLSQLVSGDLNGDGKADLAGLTSTGLVFYTTNLSGWTNIPGLINKLVTGDLNGDGKADLAGLASNGQVFYTTNLSSWGNIPGLLSKLVSGDLNGDGKADLAGIASNGQVFYTTNLSSWGNIPGLLAKLANE